MLGYILVILLFPFMFCLPLGIAVSFNVNIVCKLQSQRMELYVSYLRRATFGIIRRRLCLGISCAVWHGSKLISASTRWLPGFLMEFIPIPNRKYRTFREIATSKFSSFELEQEILLAKCKQQSWLCRLTFEINSVWCENVLLRRKFVDYRVT